MFSYVAPNTITLNTVIWKSHFGRLLNAIQDDGLCDISHDTGYSDVIHVSTNEVVMAVKALGATKASGLLWHSYRAFTL